jgi:hypothetical protein
MNLILKVDREKWNGLGNMDKHQAMEKYIQTITGIVPDWQTNTQPSVSHSRLY